MALTKQSALRSTPADPHPGADAPPPRLKLVKDDTAADFPPVQENHPGYDLLLEELSGPDASDRLSFGRPAGATSTQTQAAAGGELTEFTASSQQYFDSLLIHLTGQSRGFSRNDDDQLKETLLLMIQMLANLHRDQMAHSRHEFDRICRLLEHSQSAAGAARQAAPVAVPADPTFEKSAAPATDSNPADRGRTAPIPQAGPCGDRAASLGAQPATDATDATGSQDLLLMLSRRIATRRQERQGLGLRLLHLITGSREEAALP